MVSCVLPLRQFYSVSFHLRVRHATVRVTRTPRARSVAAGADFGVYRDYALLAHSDFAPPHVFRFGRAQRGTTRPWPVGLRHHRL